MFRLNGSDVLDPLGDILDQARFRSTIFCRSDMTAPWGFSVSSREISTFHFVECGACWLEVQDAAITIPLQTGDLVVLPHGHAHAMKDAQNSPVTRLDDLLAGGQALASGTLHFGGGGVATTLICGGFIFDHRDALPFLSALPPVLHTRERGSRIGSCLRIALEIIAGETGSDRIGANTMISRIADLIFIESVKSHFTDAAGSPRGWFAALRDRHVGKAISLIHREPHRPWTVESLASEVGMSRTAFALRFSLLLGESPIRYLASRRIARAGHLLENAQLTVAKIAENVGYDSEVAFSRAFKRHVGLSPIEYRRAHRYRGKPATTQT
jgi:AraC-like DNA-binding protein